MRVLIVKTSSLGDVIHTLPALTDAALHIPDIEFDWVVEENFVEVASWHLRVKKIIPVAIRRWRKNFFAKTTRQEFAAFLKNLRAEKYDLVIDAQGLLKSIFLAMFARGPLCGLDKQSARGGFAACFYPKKFSVSLKNHAVSRMRQLFSLALGYVLPVTTPDYGIDRKIFFDVKEENNYLVFLHGTTWDTKHWPEEYWQQLARLVNQAGFLVKLPWGNEVEYERAKRIAASCEQAEILPKLDLKDIASVLAKATAIVAVDTGIGHLAAALDVPTVSLYGATDPLLTGALGRSQIHLTAKVPCSPCLNRECLQSDFLQKRIDFPPCYTTLKPELVWSSLVRLI